MKHLALAAVLLAVAPAWGSSIASGPLAGLSVTSSIAAKGFAEANEDCLEIEAGRIPKHAELLPLEIRDGGSRVFYGAGYTIILRKSTFPLFAPDTQFYGYSYGYELYTGHLDITDDQKWPSPIASKVWFISNEEDARLEAANRGAMHAREVPMEKYYTLGVPPEPATRAPDKAAQSESNNAPEQTAPSVTPPASASAKPTADSAQEPRH